MLVELGDGIDWEVTTYRRRKTFPFRPSFQRIVMIILRPNQPHFVLVYPQRLIDLTLESLLQRPIDYGEVLPGHLMSSKSFRKLFCLHGRLGEEKSAGS